MTESSVRTLSVDTWAIPETVGASSGEAYRGIIIGLGHQGFKHVRTTLSHPEATIVGVADTDVDAREAFRDEFEGNIAVPICSDTTRLLSNLTAPPDFAIVATPHDSHMEIVRELVDQRIPILKEKPLARNLVEAQELLSIPGVEEYCFTAAQTRFSKVNEVMSRLLKNASEPTSFHFVYTLGLPQSNIGWRGNKTHAGGGSLLDMGYHVVARVVDWFGQPDSMQTILGVDDRVAKESETEDLVLLSLGYKSGLRGWVALSPTSAQKEDSFMVQFPGVYVSGEADEATLFTDNDIPIGISHAPEENLESTQLTYFLERLRSGTGFAEDQEFHLKVMEVIDLCYRSVSSRNSLDVSSAFL